MLWWVGGVSAMATAVSTWTFTGAAAKCYQDGFLLPVSHMAGVIPALLALWWIAPRFRRLRVITSMEAVFRRFGFGTEQFLHLVHDPHGIVLGRHRPEYSGCLHGGRFPH